MIHTIYLAILLFLFISCSKKENNNSNTTPLTGTWKLTEMLSDPGDGSGTYNPVQSERILIFNSNGSVSSNGSLCYMSLQTGSWESGTYSLADSTINVENCDDTPLPIRFILSSNTLELLLPCIEPCKMKFNKK